jgi:cupin 2 domain-containing protein
MENLFADLPPPCTPDEQVLRLLVQPGLRIERIVSNGQSSPPGFWYDQPHGEWVLLVEGEAFLRFEDESRPRKLRAGDYVAIAPHRRHRVDWTAADRTTVWLAIHYDSLPLPG